MERDLNKVGRRKYLMPIYEALLLKKFFEFDLVPIRIYYFLMNTKKLNLQI